MEDEYLESLKRCILDYVLMDKEEQERLGLTMKKQVRWTLATVTVPFTVCHYLTDRREACKRRNYVSCLRS